MFSNFVATIRADLDAIKDDLGEFVTTVKTDTSSILGLVPGAGGLTQAGDATASGSASRMIQWDEEIYDNPDLMCEDPETEDWEAFVASNPVKEDDVEMMLAGAYSDLIPELYRELVPSRATHADFFKRLIYHRNRLAQAAKSKVQELTMEEEETRWEDDEEEDPVVAATRPSAASIMPPPAAAAASGAPQVDLEALEKARNEAKKLKEELERVKQELAESQNRANELEKLLAESESARKSLESRLAESELPHNKPPVLAEPAKQATALRTDTPASMATPSVATASWEALPTSPGSSSNEEPVLLSKAEEDEEDDWD